jgi:hypothetical protein
MRVVVTSVLSRYNLKPFSLANKQHYMESKPLKLCSPFTTVFRFQCVPTLNDAEKTSCVLCFGKNTFTTYHFLSYNYTCVLSKLCPSLSLSLALSLLSLSLCLLFHIIILVVQHCKTSPLWIRCVKAIHPANESLKYSC